MKFNHFTVIRLAEDEEYRGGDIVGVEHRFFADFVIEFPGSPLMEVGGDRAGLDETHTNAGRVEFFARDLRQCAPFAGRGTSRALPETTAKKEVSAF